MLRISLSVTATSLFSVPVRQITDVGALYLKRRQPANASRTCGVVVPQ
jgi:hypothetical protein